jgi:amidase
VSSFILAIPVTDPAAGALRVAVKDLIDMVGLPTTCGSKVLAARTTPARVDAACLRGLRAAEAAGEVVMVGKTNLHELAFGVSGINPWFGTPVNPLDPALVPGGSSSGSAVAVGGGQADLALGSDTGGSIRIPAACCGVVGLKTTRGRIGLQGVAPLGPSLDTVGPMASNVTTTARGMELLEPGFDWRNQPAAMTIGRFRPPAEPWVDQALDGVLAGWVEAGPGRRVLEIDLPGFAGATEALGVVLAHEAWTVYEELWRSHAAELSPDVAARLEGGSHVGTDQVEAARSEGHRWGGEMEAVLGAVDLIALPVLAAGPPRLEAAERLTSIRYTAPFNLAGGPALALPIRAPGSAVPASLQLAGPNGSEEMILATALDLESLDLESCERTGSKGE